MLIALAVIGLLALSSLAVTQLIKTFRAVDRFFEETKEYKNSCNYDDYKFTIR